MDFIRALFKTVWLFFPPIIVLIIGGVALIGLEQGRDLIVTIVERESAGGLSLLGVSFWTLVTWYSTHWISNTKLIQNQVSDKWELLFHRFGPRVLGLSCYAVFQIAILNHCILKYSTLVSVVAFIGINGLFGGIGYLISKRQHTWFERWPFLFYLGLLTVLTVIILLLRMDLLLADSYSEKLSLLFLFTAIAGLFFYNIVYQRREHLKREGLITDEIVDPGEFRPFNNWRNKARNFNLLFIIISTASTILYVLAWLFIVVSQWLGPFNFVMIALGIMLGIGNILTYYSIKTRINIHALVFLGLLILSLGIRDPYQVELLPGSKNGSNRLTMTEYFEHWYERNKTRLESACVNNRVPVYVSLADGGASRSGYWVAQVLGALEDSVGISKDMLCISGASGGTIGNLAYYDLLRHRTDSFQVSSKCFLAKDFLTFTLTRLLNPAYFYNDRGLALERVLQDGNESWEDSFSELNDLLRVRNDIPILYINTTRVQDSKPALITNIKFDPVVMNDRIDLIQKVDCLDQNIRISSAGVLSSRFPYISPAGGIGNNYYVDGGYFDNSGAGAAHETLLAFEDFLKNKNPDFFKDKIEEQESCGLSLLDRIQFKVLHISNSESEVNGVDPINPILNDFAAPVIVLAGSYGQQTAINTLRLKKFLKAKSYFDSTNFVQINLYTGSKNERDYSMNWYMSDECRKRIDRRVKDETDYGVIREVIEDYRLNVKRKF